MYNELKGAIQMKLVLNIDDLLFILGLVREKTIVVGSDGYVKEKNISYGIDVEGDFEGEYMINVEWLKVALKALVDDGATEVTILGLNPPLFTHEYKPNTFKDFGTVVENNELLNT